MCIVAQINDPKLLPYGAFAASNSFVIHDRKYRPIVRLAAHEDQDEPCEGWDNMDLPGGIDCLAGEGWPAFIRVIPETAQTVDASAWIEHDKDSSVWFYNDGNPPDRDEETRNKLQVLIDSIPELAAEIQRREAAARASVEAQAKQKASEASRLKRLDRFFDLDDAGYAKWLADGRPWSDAKKIERWSERRFRELLEKPKAMPVVPFPKSPAPTNLIQTSAQFVRDFVPPDYVVDRIFQRRFCYSMTAKTGGGKTAAAMRLAAHVATGRPIGSIQVDKGTVIYAAGENPTDVQARWLGVTQEMGIDPETIDVHFINGVVKISENVANIEAEVATKGLKSSLIVVDTVAAYFEGDDDNDNVQMGNYARLLRSMTTLPGGPCVLALAHPTKRAADDDLIPKGGGAFLNEVDGNVALRRDGQVIAFEALGKFRGPSFEPVHFELVTVQHPKLRDTKGRPIPTVVARPVSDIGIMERERATERDEDALLRTIDQHPRKSRRDIGKLLGMSDSRVYRLAQKLEQQKLIRSERSGWTLTSAGQRELNAMDSRGSGVNQPPLPPARFPGAS
ncbi:AAA family ATPase [Bradyrhizobium sp. GCM10027634]|uniref:AAA family ATPase n=1 Tax=unclassified Bradyrhizobium TaxID=2631580 RepID=UPI00188B622B|nr:MULTISPECIES: AAA family ATPase [unclassified Bradyrhizobium]MDN5006159.1 AAA family ATPase [Bradyrhizobium sp. WYCCWR 12677]QOZ45106.1 hypothetical protein XH89_17700 [Bradyrhizobium sp. CCBAU 53340]